MRGVALCRDAMFSSSCAAGVTQTHTRALLCVKLSVSSLHLGLSLGPGDSPECSLYPDKKRH